MNCKELVDALSNEFNINFYKLDRKYENVTLRN